MPYKDPELRKIAQRKYAKAYYERNKAICIQRVNAQRVTARGRWRAFKATLSCVICGFAHPTALDFHHVNPSPDDKPVYQLVRNGAYRMALKEIKKCIVLCANCHRIHHNDEYLRKKAELQSFK